MELDIAKVQKIIRKAVKDYGIKTNLNSEETFVQFVSVDVLREIMTPDATPTAQASSRTKKKVEANA